MSRSAGRAPLNGWPAPKLQGGPRRITAATQEWESLGHDSGALYRGARLAEALEWRTTNEASLNTVEHGVRGR